MADKSVSVRVGVSTPGAESLKALNDQLRQMGAQAGQPIPDPTKVVADGVKRTEDAVKRARDELGRFVKAGTEPGAGATAASQIQQDLNSASQAAAKARAAIQQVGAQPVPNVTGPLNQGLQQTTAAATALSQKLSAMVALSTSTKSMQQRLNDDAQAAAKVRAAIQQVDDAMGQMARKASTPIPDPTAPMRAGIDRTRTAAETLTSKLSTLASVTATVGGFKKLSSEAISFETAMVNVRKVVDGSEGDYLALERRIMSMARYIPISQVGLAEIAAAAGQMGIAMADIPAFTELTAKAATAFNMLPSEAGSAFASLTPIFRLSIKELGQLADTINLLGNNTAASERGIIDVLTRVGATGTAVGFTREQLVALAASTLPLVRGQSERASTAINALISRLAGIRGLEPRAKQAFEQIGLTVDQFAKNLRDNAGAALEDFFKRIASFKPADRLEALLDIFGRENGDEIATISKAFDDYIRNVNLASDAVRSSGSVQTEFQKRVASTGAQLDLMKNAIRGAAIDAGGAFLPAINAVVQAFLPFINSLADFARANPTFVQGLALSVGGLVGLRSATTLMTMLFPGLIGGLNGTAGAAGAAAAGAGTAAGAFSRMQGAAGGLLRVLGGIPMAIVAVAQALPFLAKEVRRSNLADNAIGGTSVVLEDAVEGWQNLRFEKEKLDRAFADDKGSEVYRANVAMLEEGISKAANTVARLRAERKKQHDQEASQAEELKRQREAAAELEKMLAKLGKDFKPFETGGGGGKGKEEVRRALDTLIKAEIEADRKRLQSQGEVLNAELDASLGKRIISQQKYIDKKERLDLQMLDEERALLLRTRKNIEDALAVPGIKPDEKDRLLAELKRLDADVDAILYKEKTISIKADLDRAKLDEDIKALKADLARDIAELTGDTLGSTLEQIRQEKERLLKDPRFQSDPELRAQIERRAELKETQAAYNEKKRIIDETTAYLQLKEQEYQRQLDAGEISMLERERAIAAARKEAADKLREQIDVMRELAGTNPAMLLQVAQLEAQWLSLSKTVDKVALSINQAFAGGFVSAVEAALNGTERSLTGFLKRIALAAVQSWQQAAGNQLNSLVMKWLGGTWGVGGMLSQFMGGNWAGGLSKMFGGFFANGGDYPSNKFIVVGENGPELLFPGVSGSIASNTALTSAVQSMAGTTRQGGGASVASYAPTAPVFSPIIRIINEDNPQRAREAMDSAEGDTVIRNSMERNVNSLRQLLGIRQ